MIMILCKVKAIDNTGCVENVVKEDMILPTLMEL